MADKAPGKQPRKSLNVPPRNINMVNTERQQIPSSTVGPYPPIRVRGTTGHPPYYPSRNLTSPMEQTYRHVHQPVPNLRLVDLQPPARHSQPASVQDGRDLFFYNHTVLTPIPERPTRPFVQPGRAFPVPSVPTNNMDKKAEHQRIVKTRTNVAHREVEDGGRPTPKTTQNDKLKYVKKTKTKKSSNQEPPAKEQIKMPLDKKRKINLNKELSGYSGDLQTGLNNSETIKKSQVKDRAKAKANPSGPKGEKKIDSKQVKHIPKINLAVFYPPKNNDLLPAIPPVLARSLPRSLPQPLPKPIPPKLPKLPIKPVTGKSLLKPTPGSGPFWMEATPSRVLLPIRDGVDKYVPFRLPALQRATDLHNRVPPNSPVSGFYASNGHPPDRPDGDRCPWRQ